ncbi:MAG: replication factor C small subunit [Candidatus Asgardarchaeia archaeon]
MSEIMWTEKYRPKRLDEMINQKAIVNRLKSFVRDKNVPHLLFAGPPGTGKCLTGDTKVIVNDRIVRIGELIDREIEGFGVKEVMGLKVKCIDNFGRLVDAEVSYLYKGTSDRMVEIRTEMGREIVVTPSHPLLVNRKDGSIEWVKAELLNEGDRIAYPEVLFVRRENYLENELLEWLGYMLEYEFLGEGVSVRFENYEFLRERFLSLSKKLFKEFEFDYSEESNRLMLKGNKIKDTLEKYGRNPPINCMGLNRFLRAVFDSKARVEGSSLKLALKSRDTADYISYCLATFGILCKVLDEGCHYSVIIEDPRDLKSFLKKIGTHLENRKGEIMRILTEKRNEKRKRVEIDFQRIERLCRKLGLEISIDRGIVYDTAKLKTYMREFLAAIDGKINDLLSHRSMEHIAPSREVMALSGNGTVLLEAKGAHQDHSIFESKLLTIDYEFLMDLEYVAYLALSELLWDEVVEIREVEGKTVVYDLNIPHHHNFVGGNLPTILHNTTAAICLAVELYGDAWRRNYLELNASDARGIDVIRTTVKDFARTLPFGDVPFKIIVLDEADNLTPDAQQALRRTMEQYVSTCRFCLICNYSSKIIEPIQSRCAVFRFTPLKEEDIKMRLNWIAEKEGLEITEDGMNAIIYVAEGDLRKAINTLQAASAINKVVDENSVYTVIGKANPREVRELIRLAINGKFIASREKLHEMLIKYGLSASDIIRQIYKECLSYDIDERKKITLIEKIGEVDFRLSEGADEEVQLSALLAYMAMVGKGDTKNAGTLG